MLGVEKPLYMIPQPCLLNKFIELSSIDVNCTSRSINSREFLADDSEDFLDDDLEDFFDIFSLSDLREKAELACFRFDVEPLAMTDQKEICMIVSMRDQNISVQWWQ